MTANPHECSVYGKIHTMHSTPLTAVPTREEAARWTAEQVVELAGERLALGRQFEAMTREVETLKHPLEWFRRQIFGQKSEKRLLEANPQQMNLSDLPVPEFSPPPSRQRGRRPPPPAPDHRLRQGGRLVAVLRRDTRAGRDDCGPQPGR
jgi:Transposase C of IS166 homeodomain